MTTLTASATPAERWERLLAAIPLALLYCAAAAIYTWQVSRHPTPWLFSDELEYTQIARSIAESGEPARRGEPFWGAGAYPWLQAPFWWLSDVSSSYDAIKAAQALVMSAVVVPAYVLARTMVDRPWALLAAAGAVFTPAFAYAAMLIQEPVSYLYAATALMTLALAGARRTRGWTIAAVTVCLAAPLLRDQFVLFPLIGVATVGILWAQGERARRLREGWRWPQWLGVGVAAVVATVVAGYLATLRSPEWDVATSDPAGMLEQAGWAVGSLAAGLGVLPFVALIASLVRAPGIPRTPAYVALHAVTLATVPAFVAYAGAKGVYSAVTFEPRIVERNLIYLAPLAWVAVVTLIRHRSVSFVGLMAAAAVTAYAITETPYPLEIRIYGDAPGSAVLSALYDQFGWEQGEIDVLLAAMLGVSVLVLALPRIVQGRARSVTAVAAAVAVATVGWGLWGELKASDASNDFSRVFEASLGTPRNWVELASGGESVVYLGSKIADPNAIWSLEFWNPSVKRVWSVDGTAPGPGPTLTPDLVSTDGRLKGDVGFRYAIGDSGVQLAGDVVTKSGAMSLYRLTDGLRLAQSTRGVFSDGWVGSEQPATKVIAEHNQFVTPQAVPGTALVTVARKAWCSPKDVPGRVTIEVGPTALGPERNGIVAKPSAVRGWIVTACADRTFPIPTPAPPYSVRVTVEPPFQPNALDPQASLDRRYLGAQLGFDWVPSR